MSRRLTTAQALVAHLAVQQIERDGSRTPFFAGIFGIFGHGNVAGMGQAIDQDGRLRFIMPRNEQAAVHAAIAHAKVRNRLQTWAVTTSIGPGATNLVTGAAAATINRLPVLLLPGDLFASRRPDPVLQQLESAWSRTASVNDALKPVSRYWDQIQRPGQLVAALHEAMRVLTDPADTGAVTLCLPQDVAPEAHEWPDEFFAERVWTVARPRPDVDALARLVDLIRRARRPLIVAGGGVIYADASEVLARLALETGIPVGSTMAGLGALRYDHPQALGSIGATGTLAANRIALEADLVIGIGTRWSDFTTASQSAFQASDVQFVCVNVNARDAAKQAALPVTGDARVVLEELSCALAPHRVEVSYATEIATLREEWEREVVRLYELDGELPAQSAIIGAVEDHCGEDGIVICAAGSLPGELHKLWRPRHPKAYHLEYGYSCMGYEVAGGVGAALAAPDREIVVMVGDGSWLMMSSELQTAVQENLDLTVVLIESYGYASIGSLSRSVGSGGFGTRYQTRSGERLAVDLVANAASLGAKARRASSIAELRAELAAARERHGVDVIVIERSEQEVPDYDSWWEVPPAEVSEQQTVREARARYEERRRAQRLFP